ncbi:MAG: UvrD-helicase domain-containing protein [Clostridia bacterium]|nr:UvrD-helicase domain-containing protein [Clostridia bacterium]
MALTDTEREFLSIKRKLFDKVYGEMLNAEQRRAVFTTKGPLLVLAGAGSGKTTVLVNRIVYLIKYGDAYFTDHVPEGVDKNTVEALRYALEMTPDEIDSILPQFIHEPCAPWSILAFTFTNKAAGEIKDRLLSKFGDKELANSVWAGTFHSICLRILRKYADRLGYREGFSVYDADDSKRMIAQCMKELEIDEKRLAPKAVASLISRAKDRLEDPDAYEITNDPRSRDVRAIYQLYKKKMLANNAVDFDDIILETVRLLSEHEDIREYYQHKFRYVLVDEYQDTNHAQFVLTTLLSGGYRNIMVVGDDDQSIYRFRGATIENILDFDKTYPDATVVKLEQNYRSTANILGAANAIIKNNDERHEKMLWCERGDGEPVTVKEAYDQNAEGKWIVEQIIGSVYKEKRSYSDFAVLYRLNALGRTLQTAFAKSGIPFRVVGDLGFYERKEIKDMIAYLSVVSYPGDNLRLKRIINEPKRAIGNSTVSAVEELATMNGLSMFTVMERVEEYPVLSKSAEKLKKFVDLINGIKEEYELPSAILEAIYERSGYKEMLEAEGFEGEGKIENIGELISAAVEYERKMTESESEPTLLGFLEEVALITSVDKYDENADAVVLMTVHAAKGLEFPVVFLAGMEDGIFPSESDRNDKSEMNEERRLAYVAITRAKDKLYISYAKSRMMYGRTVYGMLSCFIREEVPEKFIKRDMPKKEPPRSGLDYGTRSNNGYRRESLPQSSEMRRSVTQPRTQSQTKRGAEQFGVERFSAGTRVSHSIFGAGEIVSAKDMGGDILYEVRFDSGATKKLMATFAKLKRM